LLCNGAQSHQRLGNLNQKQPRKKLIYREREIYYMKKGITPIIAIIILLLITVALSGAAWSYIQGFFYPTIAKSFTFPTGGIYCRGGNITVFVINTGYDNTLDTQTDFILAAIDGEDVTGLINEEYIVPGDTKKILNVTCKNIQACLDKGIAGQHSLDLGTTSSVQHLSVFCP
jgi:flagellin-like protein